MPLPNLIKLTTIKRSIKKDLHTCNLAFVINYHNIQKLTITYSVLLPGNLCFTDRNRNNRRFKPIIINKAVPNGDS